MSYESSNRTEPTGGTTTERTITAETPQSEQEKIERFIEDRYRELYPGGGRLTVSLADHAMTPAIFEKCPNPNVITGEMTIDGLISAMYENPKTSTTGTSTSYPGIGSPTEEWRQHLQNIHDRLTSNPTTIIPTDAPLGYFDSEFNNRLLRQPLAYTEAYKRAKFTIEQAVSMHALTIITGVAIAPEFVQAIRNAHKALHATESSSAPKINRRQFLKRVAGETLAVLLVTQQAKILGRIIQTILPENVRPTSMQEFAENQVAFEEKLPDIIYKPHFIPYTQALLEFRNTIMAYNLHRLGSHFSKQQSNPKILSYYGGGHTEIAEKFGKSPEQLKSEIEVYIKRAIYELPYKLLEDGLTKYELADAVIALAQSFPDTPIYGPSDVPLMVEGEYPSPKSLFLQELKKFLVGFQHVGYENEIYDALDSVYRMVASQSIYDQFDAGLISEAMQNKESPMRFTNSELAENYLKIAPAGIPPAWSNFSRIEPKPPSIQTLAMSSRLFGGNGDQFIRHWLPESCEFDQFGNIIGVGWYDDGDDTNGELEARGVLIRHKFFSTLEPN